MKQEELWLSQVSQYFGVVSLAISLIQMVIFGKLLVVLKSMLKNKKTPDKSANECLRPEAPRCVLWPVAGALGTQGSAKKVECIFAEILFVRPFYRAKGYANLLEVGFIF